MQWRERSELYRRQRDALEELAHIASHDLKSPLRRIASLVQLVQSSPHVVLDSESRGQLAMALDSAVQMYQVLDKLVAYTRIGGLGSTGVRGSRGAGALGPDRQAE